MDIISVEGIAPFLSNSKFSKNIYVFEILESTNNTAKEMARDGAVHGTVVLANAQTAGRGQFGKAFFSPLGSGIYMSIILRPEAISGGCCKGSPDEPGSTIECIDDCKKKSNTDPQALVTILAAVRVCEAIEDLTGKSPKTKWVNDIYLNNKKICGILTESAVEHNSGSADWTVIGIGINFDTPQEAFPEELRPVAGSLFAERSEVDGNRLIAEIMNLLLSPTELYDDEALINKYLSRLGDSEEKEHIINEIKKHFNR